MQVLQASGARIFVYLEDTGNNVEAVLLSAAKAGIAGQDGYAWVTFEQNDPETQLSQATTQAAKLRPLLYGWLNIFGYAPSATQLSRFQDVFAAADRAAVYNPVVDMPAAGFVHPFLTAYHLYAYDSVWASALGLAGGPDTAASRLVDRMRAAAFQGASGPVAFDNATGDRLADGLQLRVQSVGANLGGAAFGSVDWSTVRLSSQVVGHFEDGVGFIPAAGATPTWPGGRVSWAAPSDGSGGGRNGAILAAIIVPIVVGVPLVAAAAWCACRRADEDEADRRLRAKVAELRAELGIERTDGYLVGGERPSMWARRGAVGYLRKGYVEAAARLWVWEDFDVKSLDALCVTLLGDEVSDSDMSGSLSPPREDVELGQEVARGPARQEAYGRLCEWLLRVSEALLDPGPGPGAGAPSVQVALGLRDQSAEEQAGFLRTLSAGALPPSLNPLKLFSGVSPHRPTEEPLSLAIDAGRRFAYFADRVGRLQIWRDDGSLFRRLKEVAQRFMDDVARACDGRHAALMAEPGGAELAAYSSRDLVPSHPLSTSHGYRVSRGF